MTYEEVFRRGRRALADFPTLEAHLLLESCGGPDRGALPLRGGEPCPEETRLRYEGLLARRLAGEPLQYLLGEWEFMGLPFAVGPGVLIPRQETELLAEGVIAALRGKGSPRLLDLCSGSGCVAVSAARFVPGCRAWALELSRPAFAYLEKNIAQSGCADSVFPVSGDALRPPEAISCRSYDAIDCNPPYLTRDEMRSLQPEVRREPPEALDGGPDGLDFYRALPGVCLPLLAPGGALLLEIGETQGEAVAALLRGAGFGDVAVKKDLEGRDRLVTGRKDGPNDGGNLR